MDFLLKTVLQTLCRVTQLVVLFVEILPDPLEDVGLGERNAVAEHFPQCGAGQLDLAVVEDVLEGEINGRRALDQGLDRLDDVAEREEVDVVLAELCFRLRPVVLRYGFVDGVACEKKSRLLWYRFRMQTIMLR